METLVVVVAWILREVGGLTVRAVASRLGRVQFIGSRSGFTCISQLQDGSEVKSLYDPRNLFKDSLSHSLEIAGEFINGTGASVIYTKPQIRFQHPERDPFHYRGFTTIVNGQRSESIAIPARGLARVEFHVTVPRDLLHDFEDVLAVLEVQTDSGRRREFRLSATSFYGSRVAAWPRHGRKPIVVFGNVTEEPEAVETESRKVSKLRRRVPKRVRWLPIFLIAGVGSTGGIMAVIDHCRVRQPNGFYEWTCFYPFGEEGTALQAEDALTQAIEDFQKEYGRAPTDDEVHRMMLALDLIQHTDLIRTRVVSLAGDLLLAEVEVNCSNLTAVYLKNYAETVTEKDVREVRAVLRELGYC